MENGGRLASIENEAERDFIHGIVRKYVKQKIKVHITNIFGIYVDIVINAQIVPITTFCGL